MRVERCRADRLSMHRPRSGPWDEDDVDKAPGWLRLVERAMSAQLTEHLGYKPHREPPGVTGNTRNGSTPITLATDQGPVAAIVRRGRRGTFSKPGLRPHNQRE
jgi:transposase-like protein